MFHLLFLVPLTLACAPGTGTLGRTAVFTYGISPPAAYTYSTSPAYGQISASYAAYIAKSDVQNAINTVLLANGISTAGVTTLLNYTPPNTPIVTYCSGLDNQYVLIGGTVLYQCHASGTQTVFVVNDTVTAIYESQWQALGAQIQAQLQSKNVIFSGTNTLTVQP